MPRDINKVSPVPLNINWHEGMLLTQHHFQQNDLRNFRVLTKQIELLSSNHFGVKHLRIDQVSLSDGIYRVRELEAVFPDGLIFSFFPEKCEGLKPLEVDLNTVVQGGESEATIYLSIAESSDDVSPVLGNPARYYSIDGGLVQDDNIKENSVRIPRLFPNAFLSVGNGVPDFCIGFPLCKIIKLDGVFHVKNWTPPCFFIERHFPLWERCQELAISIREKAVYLSERMSHSSSEAAIFDSRRILEQVITVMPGLETLVYSNEIRPYELYRELSQVLGVVSVLIPTDIIPIMQPYDHNDIDSSLYRVIELIEHYLASIDRGFSVCPFTKKECFFYKYIHMDEIENAEAGKFYIGVRTDRLSPISEVENWMRDAIIVSDFALDKVRSKRVKGAKREIMTQESVSRILPGVGVVLFEVEIDEEFIKPEQNLHIFNPGSNVSVHPSEILVYIPRTSKGEGV